MIRFVLLELEVNKHMEKINVAVTDFLDHDWLVEHNSEVN